MEKRLRTWLNNRIHRCNMEIMLEDRKFLRRKSLRDVRIQKRAYLEVLDFLDSLGKNK